MSSFTYKIIKSSWGIHISIEAVWQNLSEYDEVSTKVSDKLFFANESYLTKEQAYFLSLGLRLDAPEFDESFKDKEPVVIVVKSVLYNLCDYQDEGMACAIMGWISQEFDITAPLVNVTFNRTENRYEFQFPKIGFLTSIQ